MKSKLLMFILLAALSMPAMAQNQAANVCGKAQNLISEVMDRRIEGIPAERVLRVAISEEHSAEFNRWLRDMVSLVYSLEPYQLTGDDRADILGKFFATCVRAARGEVF